MHYGSIMGQICLQTAPYEYHLCSRLLSVHYDDIIPRVAFQKKQGFPILSVRRWSDNTAYVVLTVHKVYRRQGAKKAK